MIGSVKHWAVLFIVQYPAWCSTAQVTVTGMVWCYAQSNGICDAVPYSLQSCTWYIATQDKVHCLDPCSVVSTAHLKGHRRMAVCWPGCAPSHWCGSVRSPGSHTKDSYLRNTRKQMLCLIVWRWKGLACTGAPCVSRHHHALLTRM